MVHLSPNKAPRTFSGLSLALVLAILVGANGFFPASRSAAEAKEGAPFFSLKDLSGVERTVNDYRGRVVLLNFWATWCMPCRIEMPDLEKLYRSLEDRGFVVVGISSDVFGARKVEPFVRKLGLTFPILLDPDSITTELYGAFKLPITYLVDREGNLVSRFVGPKDWTGAEMSGRIQALLEARVVPAAK